MSDGTQFAMSVAEAETAEEAEMILARLLQIEAMCDQHMQKLNASELRQ